MGGASGKSGRIEGALQKSRGSFLRKALAKGVEGGEDAGVRCAEKIPMPALRPFVFFMVALLLLQCCGGVWVALYAVSKSYQTYRTAKVAGVLAAIERLPKGKGNCSSCSRIAKAKARDDAQQKQTKANLKELLSLAFHAERARWVPAVSFFSKDYETVSGPFWCGRKDRPPYPPPRGEACPLFV